VAALLNLAAFGVPPREREVVGTPGRAALGASGHGTVDARCGRIEIGEATFDEVA
jgi:hypothetical protein